MDGGSKFRDQSHHYYFWPVYRIQHGLHFSAISQASSATKKPCQIDRALFVLITLVQFHMRFGTTSNDTAERL